MKRPRSSRLLRVLADFQQVWIVTHDFPDPDAICAGWALYWLVKQRLDVACRLVGGGDIVRAENRELVRLLSPPIELVTELSLSDDIATVLVDGDPQANNHLLARIPALPNANIDHHEDHAATVEGVAFSDVRPNVVATVSIAGSYLREQAVEPTANLASGMLYAMRTETLGHETRYSSLDRDVLPWLAERADLSKVAEIENAPLPRNYYSDLALALQNAFVYDHAALCLLPRAEGPETVAEVADLLIRCEGIKRVMCGALVGSDLMVSVRTGPEVSGAGRLAREVLDGIGSAGGHEHRAGGRVSNVATTERIGEGLQQTLRARFLAACGIERRRGVRLVAKREIVDNL
ncbi:MAG: hypothetical protein OXU20_26575 [Myxococcales bacterium]|nr:hypothetical protein [Myxococcales bacterium]MDD9966170.1 hypothetical protein [Myxococcales bacterium]